MFLLLARLLLAAVFAVAGTAKLLDRAGSRAAMLEFGVPHALAPLLGLLVPLTELVLAAALLPVATARWAALAALVLLLLFIAAMVLNLARGRRPSCRCFGQLHVAPVGRASLARNAGLAAIAAIVVWRGWEHPGPSAVSWVRGLSGVEGLALLFGSVLATSVVLEGWLLLNLLRQQGRLLLRLEALEQLSGQPGQVPVTADSPHVPSLGLTVGTRAPEFRLADVDGEPVTLSILRDGGKPVMLLFVDPTCGPCVGLLPEISLWQRQHGHRLTVALLSTGDLRANRAMRTDHGLARVLVQQDHEVADDYRSPGTPSAVVVDVDGRVTATVVGVAAIRSLAARLGERAAPLPVLQGHAGHDGGHHRPHAPSPGPRRGHTVPDFRLAQLNGEPARPTEFLRSSPTDSEAGRPGQGSRDAGS